MASKISLALYVATRAQVTGDYCTICCEQVVISPTENWVKVSVKNSRGNVYEIFTGESYATLVSTQPKAADAIASLEKVINAREQNIAKENACIVQRNH